MQERAAVTESISQWTGPIRGALERGKEILDKALVALWNAGGTLIAKGPEDTQALSGGDAHVEQGANVGSPPLSSSSADAAVELWGSIKPNLKRSKVEGVPEELKVQLDKGAQESGFSIRLYDPSDPAMSKQMGIFAIETAKAHTAPDVDSVDAWPLADSQMNFSDDWSFLAENDRTIGLPTFVAEQGGKIVAAIRGEIPGGSVRVFGQKYPGAFEFNRLESIARGAGKALLKFFVRYAYPRGFAVVGLQGPLNGFAEQWFIGDNYFKATPGVKQALDKPSQEAFLGIAHPPEAGNDIQPKQPFQWLWFGPKPTQLPSYATHPHVLLSRFATTGATTRAQAEEVVRWYTEDKPITVYSFKGELPIYEPHEMSVKDFVNEFLWFKAEHPPGSKAGWQRRTR